MISDAGRGRCRWRMGTPDLGEAYALETSDDLRRLYADWAETYDSGFAVEMDFRLPGRVADEFLRAKGTGPVLDFGCGTGLCGARLADLGIGPVDGVDLSPEMLAVAARKEVYRTLIEGNILDGPMLNDGTYAGVTSSGTFTKGHVGPEAIEALLHCAAPGALFALSINALHYHAREFAGKFESLADRITGFELFEIPLYGPNARGVHRHDRGYIALFRKA